MAASAGEPGNKETASSSSDAPSDRKTHLAYHSDWWTKQLPALLLVSAALLLVVTVYMQRGQSTIDEESRLALPPLNAPVENARALPDFSAIPSVGERKHAFFSYLAPILEDQNRHIEALRAGLENVHDRFEAGKAISATAEEWVRNLAAEYRVDLPSEFLQHATGKQQAAWKELRSRVDTIPVALGLAQAAIESGWGRSRFARIGNNLFGHWCFSAGCGMVPTARQVGAGHEVRRFRSIENSVAAYILNLNTGEAYRAFRKMRSRIRSAGKIPDAYSLAASLGNYSEQGELYSRKVQNLIRNNKLDTVYLAGESGAAIAEEP